VVPIVPGAALPSGGVEGLLLYQPGLGVGEFQAWHVTAQAGQKAIDMVCSNAKHCVFCIS
jgi:hypothetical protein